MPNRCVIVEDQEMFAQLVGGLLRSSCDLEILEIAGTLGDGLAAIDRHRPGLLILDLELPDGSGLAAAEHLLAVAPQARVVVLRPRPASSSAPMPCSRP
ncbi:MAG: response regulator [Cyanobium sp. CZS 25K]|nr:response regulator [Cyanobium sp. CZS25K]